MVFDALAFMRENARVFRKYLFLPIFFAILSLFLGKIPGFGLALSVIANAVAVAVALVGVSATRFYLLKNADAVAEGANRPFARFFFLAFMVNALTQMLGVLFLLPPSMYIVILMVVLIGLWLGLKTSLAFPALAMDHPGSLLDNLKESFIWTNGNNIKIIVAFMVCYSPVLFFFMMILQVSSFAPEAENLWGTMPQLIFHHILTIFCMMWLSLVLAKIYQEVAARR
ncbi:hypothetical protein RYZ26_10090 [Terasakiella sp. A23]|uniref:hypothetical protein n=1 Tax=Terasakiella sp. FCG-A23 TaxID=3080561 RepID=UPI002953CDA5|nr:hypothetical protein [Terasakiella sp. A23]MDV7339944.1 hypothetical protein [Terasakiella sp. A23]